MSLREVIFESFPAVINAELRMFRADGEHRLELMMTGKVNRYNDVFERVASVAMRAKLCGFNFTLNAGEMETPDRCIAALFMILPGRRSELFAIQQDLAVKSGLVAGSVQASAVANSGFQT